MAGKVGPPFGSANAAKKNRLLTDTLKRELAQHPEKVVEIITKLIDDAVAGDHASRVLIFERVDGKVPQGVDVSGTVEMNYDEALLKLLQGVAAHVGTTESEDAGSAGATTH